MDTMTAFGLGAHLHERHNVSFCQLVDQVPEHPECLTDPVELIVTQAEPEMGIIKDHSSDPTEACIESSGTNDILSDLIANASRSSRWGSNEEFVSNMRHMTAGLNEAYRDPSPGAAAAAAAAGRRNNTLSPSPTEDPAPPSAVDGVRRGRAGMSLLAQRKPSPMPGYIHAGAHGGLDASVSPGRSIGPNFLGMEAPPSHNRSRSVPQRMPDLSYGVKASSPELEPDDFEDHPDAVPAGDRMERRRSSLQDASIPVIRFAEDEDVRSLVTARGRSEEPDQGVVTVTADDVHNVRHRRGSALHPEPHGRSQSVRSLDGLSRMRSVSPGGRSSGEEALHLPLNDSPRPRSAGGSRPSGARRGSTWVEESPHEAEEEGSEGKEPGTAGPKGALGASSRGIPAGMVRESMLATLNGFEPRANMRLPAISAFPISYSPLEMSDRSTMKRDRLLTQINQRQRQAQTQVIKLADGMQSVLVRDLKNVQDAHYQEESKAQAQAREQALSAGKSQKEADTAAKARHGLLHSTNVRERQQRSAAGMLKCIMFLLQRLESLRELQLHHLKQLYEWDVRYLEKLTRLKLSKLEEQLTVERRESSAPQSPPARRQSSLRGLLRRKKKSPLHNPNTIDENDSWDVVSNASNESSQPRTARPSTADPMLSGRAQSRDSMFSVGSNDTDKSLSYEKFNHQVAVLKSEMQEQRQRVDRFFDAERTNLLQFYLDQGNRLFAMKQALQRSTQVNASFV